jgi:hypothetical protein
MIKLILKMMISIIFLVIIMWMLGVFEENRQQWSQIFHWIYLVNLYVLSIFGIFLILHLFLKEPLPKKFYIYWYKNSDDLVYIFFINIFIVIAGF